MKYTINQIRIILTIEDFLETSNTLSKIYLEYNDKEYTLENISEQKRIYKVYCASIYNLIDAVKNCKDIFGKSKFYSLFEEKINEKYKSESNKYYEKENFESNLYEVLREIRHQINHFTKKDNDDIVLFEIHIDFTIVDEVRKIVNQLFNDIYCKVDKNKVKKVIFSKSKIKYSFDKINETIDLIVAKSHESINEMNILFADDNERAIEILKEFNNPNNMFDLINKNEETIEKYDQFDREMDNLFEKQYRYVIENGTEKEKQVMILIKKFISSNEIITKNENDRRLKKFMDEIKELTETNN